MGVIALATLITGGAASGLDVRESRLPREMPSPPGQVTVVTVNAKQPKVLDVGRFERLYGLITSLRSRVPAFNGGQQGASVAPDLLMIQEMSYSNLEIFRKMLNQRSTSDYEIAAAEGVAPKFLYNEKSLTLQGPPTAWLDVCRNGTDGDEARLYQLARFLETSTGSPFTAAVVHFSPRYKGIGTEQCKSRNTAELRRQVAAETGPVIIGGDFNRRPVVEPLECDPDEKSQQMDWYTLMTSSLAGGDAFADAVRQYRARRGLTMADAWTFEHAKDVPLCGGGTGHRRTRLDYLFAVRTIVAEARTDHPGWSASRPGSRSSENVRYSDHRFVWGRFILGAPSRPDAPDLTAMRGAAVELSWPPVDGATGYVVYRARRGDPFWKIASTDAATTSFKDFATNHGVAYQYAIAPIGANGAHGFESRESIVVPDGLGPKVISTYPSQGNLGIERTAIVRLRYSEPVASDSVAVDTVALYEYLKRSDSWRRVKGRLTQPSARIIEFNPTGPLEKKKLYAVRTRTVADRLGNRAGRISYRFTTR